MSPVGLTFRSGVIESAMFSTDDTIVAIATPPGRGGIGVVRLSGPKAAAIACTLTGRSSFDPRHATLTRVADAGRSAGPGTSNSVPVEDTRLLPR